MQWELHKKAAAAEAENKAFFRRIAKMDPRKLDDLVHRLHDEVFADFDCISCANCCKSLGPRVTDADIQRISSTLKVKPTQLEGRYFRRDEDGDVVFNSMPCPFLDSENLCTIYNDRPKACREYPHTDRRRIYQILPLTLKNTFVCPAVFEIVEEMKILLRKS